ncbi:ubiquinol-cytochrome C chaperone family protein [Pseudomonas grimontii]|jgi:uncharacterized protein YaaW (UPF0174 family)|uniref:ubiquinol-cytochrome C chaperone family protein n=1 Tax=Pseudomonas grimontii TaxID=129847 RepID=UPI0021699D83|nr:ubiquinol-cytochrome C chaperone family protein [Pseudomonas grimontii]MCS3514336.1 uncharacterized protein YaaW (UPF0174 family) [Pseudomonas grimontii]
MESEIDINGDSDLLQMLIDADPVDVIVLVDFLTDSGKGRLAMASEVREALESAKKKNKFSRGVLLLLIRELQHFGGNSFVNLFRRNGVPYAEIVADVLSHVGGTGGKNEPVASMELKVLEKLLSDAWEKMSAQEQADFSKGFQNETGPLGVSYAAIQAAIRRGGPAAIQAALLATGAFARLAMGGVLATGTSLIAGRAAGLAFGPIGVALSGIAGAHTLTSQAYRVTVPCVVQIAYIRQKSALVTCPSCEVPTPKTSKFCSECGAGLAQ